MIRLFIKTGLFENAEIGLDGSQSHYLHNVMRLSSGDKVSIFNGEHGEWNAVIKTIGKKGAVIVLGEQLREQIKEPDVWLLFAPIKRSAIDLLVEKSTELGVSALWPIATRRSNVSRVNVGRLSSIAKEAAEQCERLNVPRVFSPEGFDRMISSWNKDRKLYYLDETGGGLPIKDVFMPEARKGEPAAFLIGPEGGFEKAELKKLEASKFATGISVGPRILKAETAGIVALSCWQMLCGDWGDSPTFDYENSHVKRRR